MKIFIIVAGIAVLGLIFLRKYLLTEKRIKLGSFFFRPRNLFRHEAAEAPTEVTAAEFIPMPTEVDEKSRAKADSLIKKADVHAGKNDEKGAEKLLIQALSVDPSSLEAYKRLAYLYLRQGQFGKAESIYRKLIVTITEDPTLLSNLGMALYSQQKLEDAKFFYRKALEVDTQRPGRFFSLGRILYELSEFEEALEHFKRAVAMDPSNLDYLLTLAHYYMNHGMHVDARTLLEEIVLAFPECAEAQEMLTLLKESTS
ncbi:tetratricopeptide repeat protein [Patescibacteria group bacterium]|nr:tetratricopeptide repeat protein [Patescibacteria group bacterium]MBU1703474.1 tetratricopeptide repeat protein [Patescibacteria group bacterium]MBU1953444.1 tetratricopeptide repeat protein [Patescibacteria group bacterium]